MSKEKLNKMQLTDQNYEKAVELASLVGSFLINPKYKNLQENEKEILKQLKRGHQKVSSNISQKLTSNLQNKKIENQNIDNLDLEDLLKENFTIEEIDRIKELYNNPEVREIYFSEYQKRKEGFDTLKEGYKQLNKVQKIDDLIAKAKDKIIDIRVQSFSKQTQIAPIQQSLIKKIQDGIEQKENEKNEMLKYKEIAYAYRHYKLKKYKEQLDTTGFVITSSRQKIIDETIENILLGKNVLLTGPTGTGKTVLAIQAVKTIAKKLKIGFSEISGKLLTDEIINNPKTSEELDEFVSVLSGHSGITPSEFIAKMGLKGDDKGGTQTYTQLGKVLKAFVDGNVPVIDEIDLIPNDVLMRIKHLFTLKPGKYYSPQEDNNQKYKLLTTSLIATANIKSEKHPDRQETDPAIIRLFTGIEVKYLPPEETYDLALSNLMEKQGFVYGVGENSLVDENGPLFLLITALKKIEDSYLGKGEGQSISNKSNLFLQKAVLELGNFINLFKGFKESGKDFGDFIKSKIISWLSNGAYPKNDRLILIKIFSTEGFISKSDEDIKLLSSKMSDISEAELKSNILVEEHKFPKDTIKFVDHYQLANLDPYRIRNLENLQLLDKNSLIVNKLKNLSANLSKQTNLNTDNILDLIDGVLTKYDEQKNYEIQNSDVDQILFGLYDLGLSQEIIDLSQLGDYWQKCYESIKIYDEIDENSKKIFSSTSTITDSEQPEIHEESKEKLEINLKKYILDQNKKIVDKIKTQNKMDIEGGKVAVNLTEDEIKNIQYIENKDIKIQKKEKKEITIDGKKSKFNIISLEIRGEKFTAIQIPEGIKRKRLEDLEIAKRLLVYKDNDRFPKIDFKKSIDKGWIIWQTDNAKNIDGTLKVNIYTKYESGNTDVLRECAKSGMKPISIIDSIVLGEIIKDGLGQEYIDFHSQEADANKSSYQNIRKKVEDIIKYTGIKFDEFAKNGCIIRNLGIYKAKGGREHSFVRGGFDSGDGAMGGVCSVRLIGDLGYSGSDYGFRRIL